MSRREYFDALYADHDDPYGLRTRWYEQCNRAGLRLTRRAQQ